MKCNVCREFFNPADLGQVFEHEHKNIDLKGTPIYGKRMDCDCQDEPPSPEARCKHPEGYSAMGTTTGRMYCSYCREPDPSERPLPYPEASWLCTGETCNHCNGQGTCGSGVHTAPEARCKCLVHSTFSPEEQMSKAGCTCPEVRVDWEYEAWSLLDDALADNDRKYNLPYDDFVEHYAKKISKALSAAFEKGREAR